MANLIAPEEAVQVMAQEFKIDTRCQLYVHVPGARTTLRPGGGSDRVEVTVSVSGCEHGEAQTVLDRLRLTTRQVKDTVRVEANVQEQQSNPRWWAWIRENTSATVHLDIRLPPSADTDVRVPGGTLEASDIDGSLTLRVAGGSLHAEGLRGTLDVRAKSSDVTVEWFDGSTLDLAVSSGSLTARRIDATAVGVEAAAAPVVLDRIYAAADVTVHGAETTLRDVRGRLTARVRGAPVRLEGAPGDGSQVSVHGAPLTALLSPSWTGDLEIEGRPIAIDDRLSFDGEKTPDHVTGRVNGGGSSLTLRAIRDAVRCEASG
jgi:hypothetical protein